MPRESRRNVFLIRNICCLAIVVLFIVQAFTVFFGVTTFLPCNMEFDMDIIGKSSNNWQAVDENNAAFVFAAYVIPEDFHVDWFSKIKKEILMLLGSKGTSSLMIVGATSSYDLTFYCQMWYQQGNGSSSIVVATATMLTIDTDKKRYLSTIFACTLPDERIPRKVAITSSRCSAPLGFLTPRSMNGTPDFNFTVCLCPLFNMTQQYHSNLFIEWVELNRLLGANHFIVYKYSTGRALDRVLTLYARKQLVEIIPWNLPISEYMHYLGQHAALNDCLLRSRSKSKYIVNLDMDEFIIPQQRHILTWTAMLKLLPEYSSYSFVSSFFHYSSLPQGDLVIPNNTSDLITIINTYRDKNFTLYRTKYIARTDRVQIIKIHFAHEFRWGKEMAVSPNIGLLNHYRQNYRAVQNYSERIKDTTLRDKYGLQLSRNVARILLLLQGSR